jgi:hypothetical protein
MSANHFEWFQIATFWPLVTTFKDVDVGGGVDLLEASRGVRGGSICTQGIEECKLCLAFTALGVKGDIILDMVPMESIYG